jgi:hypothetical protein
MAYAGWKESGNFKIKCMSNDKQIQKDARELVDRFMPLVEYFDRGSEEPVSYRHLAIPKAKACAIIAVENIIMEFESLYMQDATRAWRKERHDYYTQLKQAIQEL